MRVRRSIICRTVAALALLSQVSVAQEPAQDGTSKTAREDSLQRGRARWSVLPIIFSSPDTDFAFGVLPQYFFYTAPNARPSNLRMDAYYTLNRQYSIQFRPQLWLKENTYRLAATAVFREWPTDFYGIGPGTPDTAKEGFTEHEVSASAEAQRQLRRGLFVGARYRFRRSRITDTEPGGALAGGAITGSGTGTASGIGVLVSWDTRDNVYFPSSGSYHQASVDVYGGALGSDYSFGVYTLDLRQYLSLLGRHVLAVQAAASASSGAPPFRILPGIGQVLRGYGSTRYVDRARIVLQAEYRVVPVWWRLGLTVFGGVGAVGEGLGTIDLSDARWSIGIGVRFLLFREERITIRQDFGFGQGSSGDYLDLNEAF